MMKIVEPIPNFEKLRQALSILKERGPVEMKNPFGGPPVRLTYEECKKMIEDMECITNENLPITLRRETAKRFLGLVQRG